MSIEVRTDNNKTRYYDFECWGCGVKVARSLQPILCGIGPSKDGKPLCSFALREDEAGFNWKTQGPLNTYELAHSIFNEWVQRVDAGALNDFWLEHEAVFDILASRIKPVSLGGVLLNWDYAPNPLSKTAAEQLALLKTEFPFKVVFDHEDKLNQLEQAWKASEARRKEFQKKYDQLKAASADKPNGAAALVKAEAEKKKLADELERLKQQLADEDIELGATLAERLKAELLRVEAPILEHGEEAQKSAWKEIKYEVENMAVTGSTVQKRRFLIWLKAIADTPEDAEDVGRLITKVYDGFVAVNGGRVTKWVEAFRGWTMKAWGKVPDFSSRLANLWEKVKGVYISYSDSGPIKATRSKTASIWGTFKKDVAAFATSIKKAWTGDKETPMTWGSYLLAPFKTVFYGVVGTVSSLAFVPYNFFKRYIVGAGVTPAHIDEREASKDEGSSDGAQA